MIPLLTSCGRPEAAEGAEVKPMSPEELILRATRKPRNAPARPVTGAEPVAPTAGMEKVPARPVEPSSVEHRTNLHGIVIPDVPVSGRLGGEPFRLQEVVYHPGARAIQFRGEGDRSLFLFPFPGESGVELAGRRVEINTPRPRGEQPHIHLHTPRSDGSIRIEVFKRSFVLNLEFGLPSAGHIPARVYVCLPDEHESHLAGTFDLPMP